MLAAKILRPDTTLVVGPASTLENWRREWEKWGGPPGLQVISYSKLSRRGGGPQSLPLVVLDEAHYTKTPTAKRTRTALGLAARADRAWCLSGSPAPNGDPRELYSVFRYLWPELMPPGESGTMTAWEWMQHFCRWRPTPYGPKITGTRNVMKLRDMLDKVMLRRDLDDVGIELPPLRVTVHYLTDAPTVDAPDETPGPTLRRLLGAIKAGPVADLIAGELKDGAYDKIVVMYHHKATGAVLRDGMAGVVPIFRFDGNTTLQRRQEQIDGFERATRAVFLVQQQAGGVGINLQSANEIALVEPDWSPEVNAQAIKRVHRIGQDRPVRARVFAVSSTLDGPILETIAEKVDRRQEIFG